MTSPALGLIERQCAWRTWLRTQRVWADYERARLSHFPELDRYVDATAYALGQSL